MRLVVLVVVGKLHACKQLVNGKRMVGQRQFALGQLSAEDVVVVYRSHIRLHHEGKLASYENG